MEPMNPPWLRISDKVQPIKALNLNDNNDDAKMYFLSTVPLQDWSGNQELPPQGGRRHEPRWSWLLHQGLVQFHRRGSIPILDFVSNPSRFHPKLYRVYQGFRLNLNKSHELINFGSLLTVLKASNIYRGGSVVTRNLLEFKIKPPWLSWAHLNP